MTLIFTILESTDTLQISSASNCTLVDDDNAATNFPLNSWVKTTNKNNCALNECGFLFDSSKNRFDELTTSFNNFYSDTTRYS